MSQITSEQRYIIEALLKHQATYIQIGNYIGKDKSVVSREISRNRDPLTGIYNASQAQELCKQRQKAKPKTTRFTAAIKEYVDEKLELKFSPEQIVGVAKKENTTIVSHETIYQYIWQNKKEGGQLYKSLRTEGKRYRHRGASKDKRGKILNRVDIDQRPKVVEQRKRFGDLEIDTIIGKNHQSAILTINDRATGMCKLKKLQSKDADHVSSITTTILLPWKEYLRTMTADNGKEFAFHETIAHNLNLQFFFAKPYHSRERGSNENLNGLIRQYIPKKTDFNTLSDEQIQFVENQLNNRPRKRFNFKSPLEIFNHNVAFVT